MIDTRNCRCCDLELETQSSGVTMGQAASQEGMDRQQFGLGPFFTLITLIVWWGWEAERWRVWK